MRIRAFAVLLMIHGTTLVCAQVRMIPHVTNAGGSFQTTVLIQNGTDLGQRATFRAYTESGGSLGAININLDPGEIRKVNAQVFLGNDVSHFTIEAHELVSCSVEYKALVSGAAPAIVGEKVTHHRWRLYPGDWQFSFDALAIVNASSTMRADVVVRQYDLNGALIASHTVDNNLNRLGKALLVLQDHFSQVDDSIFEITGSQPLGVIALRGTPDSRLLWENTQFPARDFNLVQTSQLLGYWTVAFSIGSSTFDDMYNLSVVFSEPDDDGDYFIGGTDEFGNLDTVGFYSSSSDEWAVLDDSSVTNGDFFVFSVEGDSWSGCHFTILSGNNLSSCHNMAAQRLVLKTQQADEAVPVSLIATNADQDAVARKLTRVKSLYQMVQAQRLLDR